MNFWATKLGSSGWDELDVAALDRLAGTYPALAVREIDQVALGDVHYLGFRAPTHTAGDTPFAPHKDGAYATSGLIVDPTLQTDFRKASALSAHFDELKGAARGVYSGLRMEQDQFECVIDPLGLSTVYYTTKPGGGAQCILSNDPRAIEALLQKRTPNLEHIATELSTGDVFGYDTEYQDVKCLGENGRFLWQGQTWQATPYDDALRWFAPEASYEALIAETAREFQALGAYLHRYPRILLGLSGGYDSRLNLQMLCAQNAPSHLETYTFNSGIGGRELQIASKLAKYYGVSHTKIRLTLRDAPKFPQMLAEADQNLLPQISPLHIIQEGLIDKMEAWLRAPGSVVVSGDGGHTEMLRELNLENHDRIRPDLLVGHLMTPGLLHEDMEAKITSQTVDYLQSKYSAIKPGDLPLAYHFLERFRRATGGRSALHWSRYASYVSPYASPTFVQATVAAPLAARVKASNDSLHHELARHLHKSSLPSVPFADGTLWGQSPKWQQQRKFSRLPGRAWRKLRGQKKIETELRKAYLATERHELKAAFAGAAGSPLAKILDVHPLLASMDGPGPHGSLRGAMVLPHLRFLQGIAPAWIE